MRERRDSLGRRIGYNWWREYIMDMYRPAENAWRALRESGQSIGTSVVPGATFQTAYYQLSDAEYRTVNPRPTLKEFLIEHAGMRAKQEAA